MDFSLSLVVLASVIHLTNGGNVLILAPSRASHPLYMHALGEGIIGYGHTVYTILHPKFPLQRAGIVKGMQVLNFKSDRKLAQDDVAIHREFLDSIFTGKGDHQSTFDSFNDDCKDIFSDEDLMNKLRALHLDLIVVDVFPLNKCLVLLPHILNIPFIYHAGCPEPSWKFRIPSLASVIPIIKPFGKPKSEVMTFLERAQNFLFQVVLHVWFFPGTTDYELIKKYRQSDDITEYDQIALQAEMFFFNRDHLLEYSRWFLPNAVALGGLTARDAKTLPDDWLKFANSATDGFILVSFGSVVDSFPEHVIQKMTDAFLMVKYHVIWRISKHIPNLPQRIRTNSWIPQNDLLGHPNIRGCVTHGGNNGQYEALYQGVPLIAMPLFGDQQHNALRIKYRGYGLAVDLINFTPRELAEAINELVENSTYIQTVRHVSDIMRNRPMNARQLGGYWVDHVIKFGTAHMRSHAYDMPFYQYILLDVIVFVVSCLLISMLLLWFCIYRLCFKRSNHPKKEKLGIRKVKKSMKTE